MSRYPGRILSSTAPTVNANTAKGIWTLDEALRYSRAGQWPVPTGGGDPYFQYNTMLLPGQGTTGMQNHSFLDSSSNNFTVNRSGNTTQGTFTPFSGAAGYWGMYNSGSSYLSIADNAAFNLSGTPFTIEAWVYHVADSGAYTNWVVGKRGTGSPFTSVWALSINSTNFVEFGTTGYTWGVTSSFPIQRNTWNHIAGTYDGTSVRLYVNGVLAAGPTAATVSDVGAAVTIGNYTVGANPVFTGHISNLRIVKGTAVYTSNFTPSTTPLTAISGTSLLTCQSNRFVDNSTNAFAITVNSTPQITPFQPFGAPTTAYSASTIGGSGYFDTVGDYLSINDASNLASPGSGDFTAECWLYVPSLPSNALGASAVYHLKNDTGTSTTVFIIEITSGGALNLSTGTALIAGGTAGRVKAGAWNHLVVSRLSGTLRSFINGTVDISVSNSTTYNGSVVQIGAWRYATSDFSINGYIGGFRFQKGSGYSSVTVPTAPLTAITNTSLLLDFTNAGIIDNAQDNNLETVGGAQISTTQYKWGASSMYFDGNGDYLMMRNTENLTLGTGDFTIEFWVYYNSGLTADVALFDCRPASTAGVYPLIYSNTTGKIVWYINSAARITGTTTLTTNTWYHVAVMRTGGSTKLFINGNQDGSTYADTNNYLLGTNRPVIGAAGATLGADPLNGYIADLRITKGYARYPYNFTAPTAALPLFYQAAATPSSDPYFENTTLLLPGNGTNGAQNNSFLDSSGNGNHPSRSGNVTQGTFTPFSQTGWGNFFDGSGDYLTVASSADFNIFGGDMTFECWFYSTAASLGSRSEHLFAFVQDATNRESLYFNGTTLTFWTSSGAGNGPRITYANTPQNQWIHVAVTKSGSLFTMYINGVSVGTSTTTQYSTSNQSLQIGTYNNAGTAADSFTGYISNVRVVKGTNVYTTNFIPSTTPLTPVTNTVLLTCQSNRFIDTNTQTTAKTVTPSGDTSVQAFSPFNPTAAYSTSTVGGSGYFDGTGDFLSVTNNAAFNFGSGAFTIEFWYYPTTLSGTQCLITNYGGSTTGFVIQMGGSTAGSGKIDAGFSGDGADITSTNAVKLNSWNHIAISGTPGATGIKLFINGAQEGSTYTGATSLDTSSTLLIGEVVSTNRLSGYLSGLRLLKGTAQYTTTFTPPTAPPTAITNTSLLCNFTNGGIIDNTAKNNLETVGGASISTTVSKFGGSSMYFDGAGDSLIVPNSQNFDFGSGDFTVEVWVYPTASGAFKGIFTKRESGANYSPVQVLINSGTMALFVSTSGSSWAINTNASSSPALNTWSHIAVCRYGGTITLYLNGASVASGSVSTSSLMTNTARFVFGSESATDSGNYAGYMQDARVTKGIARYTTNFTPPTTAFLTL